MFAFIHMEASTVAAKIVEEVIAKFVVHVPAVVHSDQGPPYESYSFKEMCKLLDVQKTHTPPYHLQSDGEWSSDLIELSKQWSVPSLTTVIQT